MKAAYARQSVEKKNSISIEGQIELCENIAGEKLKVYKDRGYSGKNTDRPAFKKLLKDIENGKIEKLYVYRLDRFSRSVADFGRLWETLNAHNVEFVSVNENFDTSTPMGRAMLHIIMVFAQLERETTAERVKDNYYRRASLGAWPGGPAPYGFTTGRSRDHTGRMVPTLELEPAEAKIVRRIYEDYMKDGASLGTVARGLTVDGIPSAKRDSWDTVSVARVLHNPAYVMANEDVRLHYQALGASVTSPADDFDGVHGVLLVGKRDRANRKYTSVQDHSVSILNSRGFIPAELWLQCQNKLANNQQLSRDAMGKHTWLTGLMKCASCGYSVTVKPSKNHRYLYCVGRFSRKICKADIKVNLTELENLIADQIQSMLDECPEETVSIPKADNYAKRLDELDQKADRLMDAFAGDATLSPAYLQRALARIEKEREQLLKERKRDTSRPVLHSKIVFRTLPLDEKKTIAKQFISKIKLSRDDVEIVWQI